MAVGEEGINAEVVGADPHDVDCVAAGQCWGESRLVGHVVDGLSVVEEGWDFVVDDGREVGVDRRPYSRGDLVGADGTADGVVVEIQLRDEFIVGFGAGILDYVARPCPSTTGGAVALWVLLSICFEMLRQRSAHLWQHCSRRGGRAVVLAKIIQPILISVAVAEGHQA